MTNLGLFIAVIAAAVLVTIVAAAVVTYLRSIFGKKTSNGWSTENSLRNRFREAMILRKILADVRKNTNEWTYISDVMSDFSRHTIYNQSKKIAIGYNGNKDSAIVSIGVGIEDLEQAGPAEITAFSNGISSVIAKHKRAKRFIRKLEKLLDRRKAELEVFSEKLKERLK